MKKILVFIIFIYSCNSQHTRNGIKDKNSDDISLTDSPNPAAIPASEDVLYKDSTYSNKRFRNVKVYETGNGYFEIKGEAQVFEGTFYYFLRQNKKESDEEFVTASMGAPEWGKFDFSINANFFKKDEPLYLILFESSAKDGSRVDELTIRLF